MAPIFEAILNFVPVQTVHPSFFYLPRGVLPGSRVKMRGHLIAHRTPLSLWTRLCWNPSMSANRRKFTSLSFWRTS